MRAYSVADQLTWDTLPDELSEDDLQQAGVAPASAATREAADVILAEARPYAHNAFKVELARRAIVRGLSQAAAATPQSQTDKRIA